jgi:hypothetical protein
MYPHTVKTGGRVKVAAAGTVVVLLGLGTAACGGTSGASNAGDPASGCWRRTRARNGSSIPC